jgi:hypothetical protein
MRTPHRSILLAALAAGLTSAQAKLTVHEWGTFTVLQAPDGNILTWYQGEKDITPLPEFVTGSKAAAAAAAARASFSKASVSMPVSYAIRMETPVLYFYPDAPMDVKVTADFLQGRITETYPHALSRKGTAASWQGTLLPVTPDALTSIPDASGPEGRHYAAARAVPDAWLFRQQPAATEKGKTPPAETDHFVFYRGAGSNLSRRITATTGDDHSFQVTNNSPETVPAMFLLHAANGKSTWKRIDTLVPYKMTFDQEAAKIGKPHFREEGRVTVSLPDATEPFATSTPGLKAEMLATLEKEGLTKAEAAAMVATWDNLWFEESGTRILAVLPQQWADAVLPLQITPQPDAIDRVFVARDEMISVAQQNILVDLLFKTPADPAAAREQLRSLALGRFTAGAVDRAVAVKTRQVDSDMRTRFSQLSAPPPVAAPVVGKTP